MFFDPKVSLEQFHAIFRSDKYYESFKTIVLDQYKIKNIKHFLSQIKHESGNLRYKKEGVYSAERIMKVFGKYFKTIKYAKKYEKSERLFDKVYANRLGNDDEESKDGSRYLGRGFIQVTGKTNYARLGYLRNPEYLETSLGAWESACKWWKLYDMEKFKDDKSTVDEVTQVVNGGFNGLKHRKECYRIIKEVLS